MPGDYRSAAQDGGKSLRRAPNAGDQQTLTSASSANQKVSHFDLQSTAQPSSSAIDPAKISERPTPLSRPRNKVLKAGVAVDPHPNTLESSTLPLAQLVRQVAKRHRESALLREQTESRRQALFEQQDNAYRSQGRVLEQVRSFVQSSEDEYPGHLRQIDELRTEAFEDHRKLSKAFREANEAEEQLGQSEVSLQRAIDDLDGAVSAVCMAAGRISNGTDIAAGAPDPPLPTASASDGNSNVPSLVEEYFDSFGDLKIQQEVVFGLEQEHNEEIARRNLLEDQGLPPQDSEQDFKAHWLRKFAKEYIDLENLRKRVDRARQKCNEENIDPEEIRNRRRRSPVQSASTSSQSITAMSKLRLVAVAPDGNNVLEGLAHANFKPTFLDAFNAETAGRAGTALETASEDEHRVETRKQERTAEWLQSLSDNGQDQLQGKSLDPILAEERRER